MRSFTSQFQIGDRTNIGQVAIENTRFSLETWPHFTVILRILVGSQIWKREVKERTKLHNLHIDHVTIRLELRYITGATVGPERKKL